MALCAVNYPEISSADYEWNQDIRRRHDNLFFDVVNTHFTLVFPTDAIESSTLIEHVCQVAARFTPFEAVLHWLRWREDWPVENCPLGDGEG